MQICGVVVSVVVKLPTTVVVKLPNVDLRGRPDLCRIATKTRVDSGCGADHVSTFS